MTPTLEGGLVRHQVAAYTRSPPNIHRWVPIFDDCADEFVGDECAIAVARLDPQPGQALEMIRLSV
jgi:hypothetical protein